jgi:tetraacyldisaccharide 4'-kinase
MNRFLIPLAWGFRCGVGLRSLSYRRGWREKRRLSRPVVSVGNLSVGGTGKTPLVQELALILLQNGLKPSILTRGYGRRSTEELILLEPGVARSSDPRQVGDEPALLARALPSVPIAVSSDRFAAGRAAEERFNVDVHILDDGFQHLALERDLDIVAVDATQELSANALLPAGRLREPPSALRRANIVVLTRCDLADGANIATKVARIAPHAQVFQSFTRLVKLVEVGTGAVYSPEAVRSGGGMAFCGIGNPRAFFSDLALWGFTVVSEKIWRDHHIYSAHEINEMMLEAGRIKAVALLTTEKDAMNLPQLPPASASRMPIFACSIRAEIEEEQNFAEAILGAAKARRLRA